MRLVGSKPIRSNVKIPKTSFLHIFFSTNDIMCRALWHHLLSLPYQFSIFEDVRGWQPRVTCIYIYTCTVILLHIVMVSHGSHLVENHESQSRTNVYVSHLKKMTTKLKMLGPLYNQTVNLKTDLKTLYYSILKLKYTWSPSILKHNNG